MHLSVMQRHTENWNLGRSWHFGFWLSRSPPLSQLKSRQISTLWVFWVYITPPPPPWRLQYVETNACIPQGYHLVWVLWAVVVDHPDPSDWQFPSISFGKSHFYVNKHVQVSGSKKTRLPCWLSRSAGVALELTLQNQLHAGEGACKQGIHKDFET